MEAQESTTEGVKADAGKVRLDLIPPAGLMAVGKVMTYGAAKYGDHNYRMGMRHGRLIAASLRHITAYLNGEDNDPETGLSHIAHGGACLLMLLQGICDHPELDDRYKELPHGNMVKAGCPERDVCIDGNFGVCGNTVPVETAKRGCC